MKIGNSPEMHASAHVGTERPAAANAGRTNANAGAKAPESSAQIELSSTASKLLSGVPDDGSFDAEKVARISQAIAEGSFKVNPEAIADKLLANAQEMVTRMSPH